MNSPQGSQTPRLTNWSTYAIAGADGLFIVKEMGGDAVDLVRLFELHAHALYDTAVRLISESASDDVETQRDSDSADLLYAVPTGRAAIDPFTERFPGRSVRCASPAKSSHSVMHLVLLDCRLKKARYRRPRGAAGYRCAVVGPLRPPGHRPTGRRRHRERDVEGARRPSDMA